MRGLSSLRVDEKELIHIEAIIDSMTPRERQNHQILNGAGGRGSHAAADGRCRRSTVS